MLAEAEAHMNFCSHPFILKEGEDKVAQQKKTKGVREHCNLSPDDIVVIEADDLVSIGDEANTETVFEVDNNVHKDDNLADDDVSRMSDHEGSNDKDSEEDKIIVAPEDKDDADIHMEDSSVDDHDSAFSTKADLNNLVKGRCKIGHDFTASDKARIRKLEKEKEMMEDVMTKKVRDMEFEFEEKMNGIFKCLRKKERK